MLKQPHSFFNEVRRFMSLHLTSHKHQQIQPRYLRLYPFPFKDAENASEKRRQKLSPLGKVRPAAT